MKQELLKLLEEFSEAVERYNQGGRHPLEDKLEPTVDNLIKWLRYETFF